ncbi:MAG TPA: DUF5060 domain-containing protein [Thermoanaerobaculia bacterium]|nr:DUF5060 domain-containing protein [Thermoanaerobaculia bacterium]
MAKRALSFAVLAAFLTVAAPLAAQSVIPKYGTAEIPLASTSSYNAVSGTPNPFDLVVTAKVTSPTGRIYNVDGFFDGNGAGGSTGNVFKLRVYGDEVGTWRWTTTSTVPGLGGKSGTFSVSGTLAGFFGKGPIVENPAYPRSFMQQGGEPVFLSAKFLDSAAPAPIKFSHTLLSEKLTDANRQAMLTRHTGMKLNKMNVYLANRGDYSAMSVTPWVGTATANDKKRFDLARWRMFDQWTVKLRDAGMQANFWFFADDSGFGDLPDADRQRLIRYGMARLSGYVHTTFTLALEWQEGWTTTEVNNHANYIHSWNPWARLVSVHGLTGDFSFPTAAWADYMQLQGGNDASAAVVHSRGLTNRAKAAKPLIQEEHGMGWEDKLHRQRAWAAFTGGAAGVGTGAFLNHLATFAARVDFERMEPLDSLIRSGSAWCLAEKGRAYVVYIHTGTTVGLDLTGITGTFVAEWYDPRTGAVRVAPAATGGGVRTFTAPTADDWVLYLRR